MERAAAMRPCLAAGVCWDVGVEVGFGIGCAGAHVSISAKSFGREPNGFLVSPPGSWQWGLGAFGVLLMALVTVTAKSVVVSFSAIGSIAVFLRRLMSPSAAWPLCFGEGGGILVLGLLESLCFSARP